MTQPSIVDTLRTNAEFDGGPTSITLTLPKPSGVAIGDLIVLNARLHAQTEASGVVYRGAISSSELTLVDGFGTPDGYKLTPSSSRTRSLYIQTRVGRHTGQASYEMTFTIDRPVVVTGGAGDATAGCEMFVTAIRDVLNWNAGRATYDRGTTPWVLGSGVSSGGVYGFVARYPSPSGVSVQTGAGSPGTCTTPLGPDSGRRRFWDFTNTYWVMPTIDTSILTADAGAACWLALNVAPEKRGWSVGIQAGRLFGWNVAG